MRLSVPASVRPRPDALSAIETAGLDRSDRVAAWWLQGPLTFALLALGTVQILSWLPHYLTWPWWADHDVFATMALGWSQGLLPYRDLVGNNFPGSIYLFWAAGALLGWGKTTPFLALDALLLLTMLVGILRWSRCRFQTRLPGAVGVLAVLAYVLSLDYTQAAQRDSQAPMLTILAILSAETGGAVFGPVLAGLLAAAGWSIRPQTVLLWPALVLAIAQTSARHSGPGQLRKAVAAGLFRSGVSLSIGLGLVLAPLACAGVLGDFVRSLRESTLGESYLRLSLTSFLAGMIHQLSMRDFVTVAATLLMIRQAPASIRRSALVWLVGLGGVLLYRPLSPFPHAYLDHPRMLVSALNLAVLAAMIREVGAISPSIRLAGLLVVIALGSVLRPVFANPSESLRALPRVLQGKAPWSKPIGYRPNPSVMLSGLYQWKDYRYTLAYLRDHTGPDTRIANVLSGVPALCGPLGRLPVFPAESIAWLAVRPDAEPAFVKALETSEDSVVVWSPEEMTREPEPGRPRVAGSLGPVIRRLYEPETSFGPIEIWRRRR